MQYISLSISMLYVQHIICICSNIRLGQSFSRCTQNWVFCQVDWCFFLILRKPNQTALYRVVKFIDIYTDFINNLHRMYILNPSTYSTGRKFSTSWVVEHYLSYYIYKRIVPLCHAFFNFRKLQKMALLHLLKIRLTWILILYFQTCYI
jgi:hypothetical protein